MLLGYLRGITLLSVKFGALRSPDGRFVGVDARPAAVQTFLATCRELGMGVTAYGVVAQGLLSGAFRPAEGGPGTRGHLPRFAAGNVDANLALTAELEQIVGPLGVTVAQLAIAWVRDA